MTMLKSDFIKRQSVYAITPAKILSEDEALHLKRIVERNMKLGDRNALMIVIAKECGLRASEVLRLRIKDFAHTGETSLHISTLKGGNPRTLPIRPSLARYLKSFILEKNNVDYIEQLDANKKIFEICYQRLNQVWDLYRPSPFKTFHSLRHTFAVELYMRTKDIKLVQLALGHRSINNTMVYVDFCYSQTELRRQMIISL